MMENNFFVSRKAVNIKMLSYFYKTEWLQRAQKALLVKTVHITDQICPLSQRTPHDFYSNGDYWWPNPEKKDGLPYIPPGRAL